MHKKFLRKTTLTSLLLVLLGQLVPTVTQGTRFEEIEQLDKIRAKIQSRAQTRRQQHEWVTEILSASPSSYQMQTESCRVCAVGKKADRRPQFCQSAWYQNLGEDEDKFYQLIRRVNTWLPEAVGYNEYQINDEDLFDLCCEETIRELFLFAKRLDSRSAPLAIDLPVPAEGPLPAVLSPVAPAYVPPPAPEYVAYQERVRQLNPREAHLPGAISISTNDISTLRSNLITPIL